MFMNKKMSKKAIEKAKEFMREVKSLNDIGMLKRSNLGDILRPMKISHSNFMRDIYPLVKGEIEIRPKRYKKITKNGQLILGKKYAKYFLFRALTNLPVGAEERQAFLDCIKSVTRNDTLGPSLISSNKKKVKALENIFHIVKEPPLKGYFIKELIRISQRISKTKNVNEANDVISKEAIELLKDVKLSKKNTCYYVEKGKWITSGKEVILRKKRLSI